LIELIHFHFDFKIQLGLKKSFLSFSSFFKMIYIYREFSAQKQRAKFLLQGFCFGGLQFWLGNRNSVVSGSMRGNGPS